MIWLDRDTPTPALRLVAHDLMLARSWPVHPDAVTWCDFVSGLGNVFRTRRVVVAFESGWSASILWGTGSYSTNHDAWLEADPFTDRPHTVEVGVIHDDHLVGDPLAEVAAVDLAIVLDLLATGGYERGGDVERDRAAARRDARDVE